MYCLGLPWEVAGLDGNSFDVFLLVGEIDVVIPLNDWIEFSFEALRPEMVTFGGSF